MTQQRRRGDDGTALVEFTHLSMLLLVPLVYLILFVFTLQRAGFAVSAAAREAGRAYVTAPSDAVGRARAEQVASMTLADHDVEEGSVTLSIGDPTELPTTGTGLVPTRGVRVEVRHRVDLPVIGGLFRGLRLGSVPVTGAHLAVFDTYATR